MASCKGRDRELLTLALVACGGVIDGELVDHRADLPPALQLWSRKLGLAEQWVRGVQVREGTSAAPAPSDLPIGEIGRE
ncbi:hypothetical protein E1287_35060 [Actinomadura sp. KC06]|nr:hypothetical protein E1287_35060 [Actinomadura sp. KC06]